MRIAVVGFLAFSLTGCGAPSGPASTDTSSTSLPSLAERLAFLQRYVTCRRHYRDLGFHIKYQNNGGRLVPAPSFWDVRVVAAVPPDELAAWVPAGVTATTKVDREWLANVPGAEHAAVITEWYVGPGLTVGVDRVRSIVAYRHLSN